MRPRLILSLTLLCVGLAPMTRSLGLAVEWNPQAFAKEETLEMRTVGAEEGEYWFPVWVAVIDGQVYVRLGARAADRVKGNTTAPYVGVKIAGQQFDRVKAEEASDMAESVAGVMAGKYWSDVFVRFFPHPLTLRLLPDAGK